MSRIVSEKYRKAHTTHGDAGQRRGTRTVEYGVWATMKARCQNPNSHKYARYGGRGIRVCTRWQEYENFIADMGRRPSAEHSIDRIDLEGDYEPSNCRWATAKVQQSNTSRSRRISVDGVAATIAEWARGCGVYYSKILVRLNMGWTPAESIGWEIRALVKK